MRRHQPLKHVPPTLTTLSAKNHHADSSDTHFLHAGQVFVSAEAKSIVLILGSCVGVCVWDAINAIGGATHYLLPSWDGAGAASPRYGNLAISILIQKLLEAGANRGQLRAKVFGGGCLFDSLRAPDPNGKQHLGSRNVGVALEMLKKAQVPVVSTVVGVDRGQRIVFRTDTGDAEIRVL